MCVCVCVRETETETDGERQRDRQTDRDRETERHATNKQTNKQNKQTYQWTCTRESERHKDKHTHTHTQRDHHCTTVRKTPFLTVHIIARPIQQDLKGCLERSGTRAAHACPNHNNAARRQGGIRGLIHGSWIRGRGNGSSGRHHKCKFRRGMCRCPLPLPAAVPAVVCPFHCNFQFSR